ncbi:MAG: outer membrane lipoprotein carrier protein LolA [Bacteroidia bacterium]|nr:outer membrane lipoprotein carrier protein LolA [Bacteroidia bacterium]
MKRVIVILTTILVSSFSLFAQTMSEEQIKDEVYNVIKGIHSLQCDFIQTKCVRMLAEPSVSYGAMAYQQERKLRWEYKRPFSHTFILNDTQVQIQDKNGKENIDVEKSRIFKEVVKMMNDDILGQSLKEGKLFSVTCTADNNEYIATLSSQNKRTKSLFSTIVLHIDRVKRVLTTIEISSKGGDTSKLSFHNIVVNSSVDNTLFNIN